MQFVYIGDAEGHGPDFTVAFGCKFAKSGAPVAVEDAAAVQKLLGNSHFRAVEPAPVKRGPGRPRKVKRDGDQG